jgi:hypothetical protein
MCGCEAEDAPAVESGSIILLAVSLEAGARGVAGATPFGIIVGEPDAAFYLGGEKMLRPGEVEAPAAGGVEAVLALGSGKAGQTDLVGQFFF